MWFTLDGDCRSSLGLYSHVLWRREHLSSPCVPLCGSQQLTDVEFMNEYSPTTRVELTLSGWLLIALSHYEMAIKNNDAGQEQQGKCEREAGHRALRQATGLGLQPCDGRSPTKLKSMGNE
jgi:hypothetical protein